MAAINTPTLPHLAPRKTLLIYHTCFPTRLKGAPEPLITAPQAAATNRIGVDAGNKAHFLFQCCLAVCNECDALGCGARGGHQASPQS